MICNEMIIEVNDGRINNRVPFREFLHDLENGTYNAVFTPRNVRTLNQNAYYHSVFVPMMKKALIRAGYDDIRTNDDAHEVLKAVFNKKQVRNKLTGKITTVSGSTRRMSKAEFSEYLERIAKGAAEYLGVVIPAPNQFINE